MEEKTSQAAAKEIKSGKQSSEKKASPFYQHSARPASVYQAGNTLTPGSHTDGGGYTDCQRYYYK